MEQQFVRTFPSVVYNVKKVAKELTCYLHAQVPQLSSDDEFELKLIFNELLFNAVIHGNKEDSSKEVTLQVEVQSEDIIYAIVTDEGLGFDYVKLMEEHGSENGLFGENGRGIRLVSKLTDNMIFNISGNEIKFYKRVKLNG